MTTLSRKDLKDLLKSYKEALRFWLESIKSEGEISKIRAAEVKEPLEELQKVTKLIKAHTTKVGIIFKPEVLEKETETSFNTLQKLSESIVLLVSLVAQLNPNDISQIFFDEIVYCINEILRSNIQLVDQLMVLEHISDPYNDANDGQDSGDGGVNVPGVETSDGRLVSVGKVWSSCDGMIKILQDGRLGVLRVKFKQSIGLIEDGLDEFDEWAENPEEFDDDDPFGLDDSEEDEEEQEEQANPPSSGKGDETDDEDTEIKRNQLITVSKSWLNKFKLIKLLLTSTSKSLPSVTSGDTINIIYQAQKDIVNLIDKLIVELMMNGLTPSGKQYGDGITKNCNTILKVVKEVNKSNDTKVKWCTSWQSKYQDE